MTKTFNKAMLDNIIIVSNEFIIFVGILMSFSIENSYDSFKSNDFHSKTVTAFLYGVKIYIIAMIILEMIKIQIYTYFIIKRKYAHEKLEAQVCNNSNDENNSVREVNLDNLNDVNPEEIIINEQRQEQKLL